jgi:hypothetical protein
MTTVVSRPFYAQCCLVTSRQDKITINSQLWNLSKLWGTSVIWELYHFCLPYDTVDRLCGLVVRVSGYRYRGLGFDSRRYQIFLVEGLERGPLSLVRSIEDLLE